MKYVAMVLVLGVGLILSACGGSDTTVDTPEATDSPTPAAAPQPEVLQVTKKKDIGDLEAGIEYNLTVDEEVAAAGVSSEKLENQMSKLNMVTVTVEGARPEELWLNVDLETQLEFPERPVAARGRIIRELEGGQRTTIYTFETVFDENASTRKRRVEGNFPPQHFRVEALQGMTELPETMLVFGEMDVVFMPEGTDPATIEPSTAEGGPDDVGMLLSNPVRINFDLDPAPAPAPTPEETAPVPGAPDAPATEDDVPIIDAAAPEAEAAPEPAAEAAPSNPAPAAEAPEAAVATEAPASADS